LHLTVDNPDELRNAGAYDTGALMRLQSSATEAGAYADLTGTGSTPTILLVAATRAYTGFDPAGTSSTWYRTRFENTGGTRVSDWSASFQVGDEGAGQLCSLYDVQQRLGFTDASQDENIIEFIRQVSSWLNFYTGRTLAPDPFSGTKVYRVHTRAGRTLWLPKGIRSVTTLGIATDDQPATGGTYTTATASDYYIDPPEFERDPGWPGNRIVLRSNGSSIFYNASYGAEITGSFGFPAVTPEIQALAARLVVAEHQRKGSAGGEQVTIGIGGQRTFEYALSRNDWMTLQSYRVPAVA
jgi:hypothetical protein